MSGRINPMKFPGIVGIPIHWLITMVKHTVQRYQRKSFLIASHHSMSTIIADTMLINQLSCVPKPGKVILINTPGEPGGKFCWNLYITRRYWIIQSGTRNNPRMDKNIIVIKNHKINNFRLRVAAHIKVKINTRMNWPFHLAPPSIRQKKRDTPPLQIRWGIPAGDSGGSRNGRRPNGPSVMILHHLSAAWPADAVGCRLGAVLHHSIAPSADFLDGCFFPGVLNHGGLLTLLPLELPDLSYGRRDCKYPDVVTFGICRKEKKAWSARIVA